MAQSLTVKIVDASSVGAARRLARSLAAELGFSEERAGKVAIVATEMGRNLWTHVHGGEIFLTKMELGEEVALELLAVDSGPGMENPARSLVDGFSSAGSAGIGLGAMQRLADVFDLYSLPGRGTVVLARFRGGETPRAQPGIEIGALCVARPGESCCGDGWAVRYCDRLCLLLVVDGLGHGAAAAAAADVAVAGFKQSTRHQPRALVDELHQNLRSSRGGAVAVAAVDGKRHELTFAGIGNIGGTIISTTGWRHLLSCEGIAGHQARRLQEFVYPWPPGATLVLHSDGIKARWGIDDYPGILSRQPGLLAALLHRDFCRGNDDSTVVVAQETRAR